MGLNDSYMNIRSQILMMTPLPTVAQAFSLISQEESHRLLSSVESPASVFYSRQGRNDDYKRNDERRNDVHRRNTLTCEHCGWTGHIKATCFKLNGYPPGHKYYKPQQGRGIFLPSVHLRSLINQEWDLWLTILQKETSLCLNHSCSVTFYSHYCKFQDLKSGKTIWIGREHHGLYYLSVVQSQIPHIQINSALS